jgi:hypothetical protein
VANIFGSGLSGLGCNITHNIIRARVYIDKTVQGKESRPKGPGFGLPLKGAVLLKAVQVKSA